MLRVLRSLTFVLLAASVHASLAQSAQLSNPSTTAAFGPRGLVSITDLTSNTRIDLASDEWTLTLNQHVLRSRDARHVQRTTSATEITYAYDLSPWQIDVVYELKPGWTFVSKQLRVITAPAPTYTLDRIVPWDLQLKTPPASDFVPSVYTPQFGSTLEQSRKSLPGKDYGDFLRFADGTGAFLAIQNPFLSVQRDHASITIAYSPDMQWQSSWGSFSSDTACLGAYRLSGVRNSREMTTEWHLPPASSPTDGMDKAEVDAFTAAVRAFVLDPSPDPISVLVGWTFNDYQIDVGTPAGRDEYKRIIDTASDLGIKTLLYAPGNSQTAQRAQSVDTWKWEYVLWLGMGQQLRKNQWDPAKDPLPSSVTEMLDHAKQRHVGLLAYVYPSIPYEKDPSWIVQGTPPRYGGARYATLASRPLQDYLIRNLIAFKKRTGVAGYSFDYDFLDLPGSSSYAQWYGWRRVMETLRRTFPDIVIDGRQSYQLYGPWSWLAGSYPHPTGTDEQPESFKPYPDLHFDRVSADRTRFVNYWYRNYQFAPEELVPGYATHQTERSRNLPTVKGQKPKSEMMTTRYRARDWDYLGFRYSFLSSIATAGWNNVVDMIPARDPEESRHFSPADKAWIRNWLEWTVQHKDDLRHTRTILDQPAMGHVDGTSALNGDRGFLFLFNPNYKSLPADFSLDDSIGLTAGQHYLLKEIEPFSGRLIANPQHGLWTRGDRVHLQLDGTSAAVLELVPFTPTDQPLVFNAAALSSDTPPRAELHNGSLSLTHIAGEPGVATTVGVLLPSSTAVSAVTINGTSTPFTQTGEFLQAKITFSGDRFAQAQQISLSSGDNRQLTGSFAVPQRIFDQLAARHRAWPIPWTKEDYQTTWLVPERLLLFIQAADATDAASVHATLDGQPLTFQPAYTSTRVDSPCFVGFYADLSAIAPTVRHTLHLSLSGIPPEQLQGVFFDNVELQLTESITPQSHASLARSN